MVFSLFEWANLVQSVDPKGFMGNSFAVLSVCRYQHHQLISNLNYTFITLDSRKCDNLFTREPAEWIAVQVVAIGMISLALGAFIMFWLPLISCQQLEGPPDVLTEASAGVSLVQAPFSPHRFPDEDPAGPVDKWLVDTIIHARPRPPFRVALISVISGPLPIWFHYFAQSVASSENTGSGKQASYYLR